MKYYSTNHTAPKATLAEAVIHGLAPDRGLYMPERIERLPESFFRNIENLSFREISFEVAKAFFGEDINEEELRDIVYDTLSFDCPVVNVSPGIRALELFHGPTLAFKDVGARFMARVISHLVRTGRPASVSTGGINVLVATSGDTGSAVANGFLGVDGIHVHVLYPKGKVSPIQESQFATLGRNITAIEVDGTFDDCQALVKDAFADAELNRLTSLTSANSINVARFLPQAFYYFNAYARMKEQGCGNGIVVSVPSGNFGNLTSGLFARRMGLPVKRFIAANNANDVFYEYLKTGTYTPRPSIQTIANAMDVGAPSNFARILELYHNSHAGITADISGAAFSDGQIREAVALCYKADGYLTDPHGACAWRALAESLQPGETGLFLETAHPAKFKETIEPVIGAPVSVPPRLAAFMHGRKQSIPMTNRYDDFRQYLSTL